ncbi:MAG: DUF4019 domain-containing protein [Lentisphaerae bacterium]|nr:DUF4019 domain-containing protein [Lentisphaerota bacterium]
MRHPSVVIGMAAALLAVVVASCSSPETKAKEAAAVAAAEAWLKMTDAGDAAGSWQASAEFFRKAVTQEQWTKSLSAARAPLGGLLNRTVKARKYATRLPGAPDGEYVVILFRSSFANKKSAVETVTPMLDPDGAWRVSGYFIR